MKNQFYVFLFFCSFIVIQSCNDTVVSNRPMPDVSDVDVNLDLIRFDRLVFALDTNNIGMELEQLQVDYPQFSELYFGERLTGFKNENSDSFNLTVNNFIKDTNMLELQGKIESSFGDLKEVREDLTQSLKYLKHYFPEYTTPAFYTLNSEYGFQSFIFNEKERDGIGIGLDLFLGSDIDYKQIDPRNTSFSDYLAVTYNEDYIVRKSMAAVTQFLLGDPSGKRFIDQMIYNGKKLYLLQHFLPTAHDSIILEFTDPQVDWLQNNEMEIWSFFLEKNIMYETNFYEINKYINPAPNSPGMPAEAPGNTASFIGLQIVKSFMKRNPEMNLQDLIAFHDSQKLLELSKYKPKR